MVSRVLLPWCPRCGAWRGYVNPLCKGCTQIEQQVTQLPTKEEQDIARKSAVLNRFVEVSEQRTDREAYTQALEEMVENNIELLKSVAYDWMRMRPESRRVRFASMRAVEMIQVARAALEEVGSLSLELTKFTENKAA